MIKPWILLLSFFLCFSLVAEPVAKITIGSQEITAQIQFAPYATTPYHSTYQQLVIPGLPVVVAPGKPELPFYPCHILLPPDREVTDVIVTGEKQVARLATRIKPAAVPLPWFIKESRGKLAIEDPVYATDRLFPGYLNSPWQITTLAGYQAVSCNIYPLQYNPITGELVSYSELKVVIHLAQVRKTTGVCGDYESRVSSWVCNPETVRDYQSREYRLTSKQDVPYVIITAQSLLNLDVSYSFEYFRDFLIAKGVNAKIVTVEEIYAGYQGKDKAEQVRNFIKYAFTTWNTRYVLLGGDGDKGSEVVPVRRFKTDLFYRYADNTTLTVHEMMAADYYYCALDGDFDANHNGYYGEPADSIDLQPEVAIGRAPVDNKTQVNNFVRKTILAYQHADTVATPKVLFLGEHLFSPGQCGVDHNIYGDWFMEELRQGATTHGFATCGYTNAWAYGKLYDKEKSWGSTDVKRELSNYGACWVNHIGHSSPSTNMRLYTSSIASLTNEVPFFYVSQGCNAARFTNEATAPMGQRDDGRYSDCISEALVYADKGAFAVMANWSYGLSPEDPETPSGDTPGASQYFHRWLVDAFFNPAVKLSRLGDMLGYSRVKMNPWLLDSQMQTQTVRWVYYEFILLGDPHAPLPQR